MARSTFKVLFYLKKNNLKDGKAPVMGRITVNSTIAQFSYKKPGQLCQIWEV